MALSDRVRLRNATGKKQAFIDIAKMYFHVKNHDSTFMTGHVKNMIPCISELVTAVGALAGQF